MLDKGGNAEGKLHPTVYIVSVTQTQCKLWDPTGTAKICTLIDTNLCKPDDGQARPKHVADVQRRFNTITFLLRAQRDGSSPIQH